MEFASGSAAARALKSTNFVYSMKIDKGRRDVTVPMIVEKHKTKNYSRGVINCYDLKDQTDEEIVDGLEEYGVVAARRIRVETPSSQRTV